jgi:hypothetical protein
MSKTLIHHSPWGHPKISWECLTKETRDGWAMPTVKTEANGDSRSTYERGPYLVGSLGSLCRNKRCLYFLGCSSRSRGGTTWTGDFKCREVKTGFCRNRSMQTASSETLIGWKSGQTTYVPLWYRIGGSVAMDSVQNTIFLTVRYTFSLHLSPSPSKLGS